MLLLRVNRFMVEPRILTIPRLLHRRQKSLNINSTWTRIIAWLFIIIKTKKVIIVLQNQNQDQKHLKSNIIKSLAFNWMKIMCQEYGRKSKMNLLRLKKKSELCTTNLTSNKATTTLKFPSTSIRKNRKNGQKWYWMKACHIKIIWKLSKANSIHLRISDTTKVWTAQSTLLNHSYNEFRLKRN